MSGGVALAYEVLWTRELLNLLGSTTQASASVLAAFMAGLALGAWVGGRSSARMGRPLWLYAIAEAVLAALGLAIPSLLRHWPAIFSGAAGSIAASTALLFVPAFLMGIALPALAAAMQEYGADRPKHLALLYGVNTLGGSVAAVLVGFGSLPFFGLAASEKATVLVGLAAAAAAAALGLTNPALSAPAVDMAPRADPSQPRRAPLVVALFLTGAAALGYEILWTRILVLVLGSSTNAFTAMLSFYLLGVAIGGFWIGRFIDRLRAPSIAYQHLQLGVAGMALLGVALFGSLPALALFGFATLGTSASGIASVDSLLAAIIIVPPTILIGASLPVAARLLGIGVSVPRRGRELGTALAWVTAGNVAGVLAAAFAIIPAVGLRRGVILLAALNLAGACVLWIAERQQGGAKQNVLVPAIALMTGFCVLIIPPWNVAIMTSGVFRQAPAYLALLGSAGHLERAFAAYRTRYYREGPEAVVAVFDRPTLQGTPHRVLTIDGKVDASTGADMATQVLSGHLPFLFRPDARDVLVIGLASGVTVGALATHPLERIHVVEIEPSVVEASHAFDDVSGAPLRDARVGITVEDGRRYLRAATTRYDIVVSEPSNPWLSMSARLFTREFFELVRRRLTPSGLLVQWVPLYGLSTPQFEALLRTLLGVFPHLVVFQVAEGDLVVIASPGRIAFNPTGLQALFKGSAALALHRVGIDAPAELLSRWIADAGGLRSILPPGPLNTDDNGLLEFGSPWYVLQDTAAANLSLVNRGVNSSDVARRLIDALPATGGNTDLLTDIATRQLASGRIDLARQLAEALGAKGYRREADLLSGDIASAEGHGKEATRIWSRHSGAAFWVRRARLALKGGRPADAAHLFEKAGEASLSPEDALIYALSLADMGMPEAALRVLQRTRPEPNSQDAILAPLIKAELLRETGSTVEATRAQRDFEARLDDLRRCLEKDGCRPALDGLLAWSSAGSPGLPPAAGEELRQSLYLRITRPLPLYMRGVSELWLGERRAARTSFHTYLMLLPEPDPLSAAHALLVSSE